jgi:hypothetical protein
MRVKAFYGIVGACVIALLLASLPGCTEMEYASNEDMIIGPMLSTEWNQRNESVGDYAKYAPTEPGSGGSNWRLGCWSIALAQIFYYYRLEPRGTTSYDTSPGCTSKGFPCHISENFDSYAFTWNLFVDYFDTLTTSQQENEVARYAYYTAVAVQKDFGTGTYVGNPGSNFLDNFQCTATAYDFDEDGDGDDYSFEELKDIIIDEIRNGHPVMLYLTNPAEGLAHAVVADGIWGTRFVHINMGHGPNICSGHPCNTFYTWDAIGAYTTIRRVLTIESRKATVVPDIEKLTEGIPSIGDDECVQIIPVADPQPRWTARVIDANDIQVCDMSPDFWNTDYAEEILPEEPLR